MQSFENKAAPYEMQSGRKQNCSRSFVFKLIYNSASVFFLCIPSKKFAHSYNMCHNIIYIHYIEVHYERLF